MKDILYFNGEIQAKNIIIYDTQGKQLVVINIFSGNSLDVSKLKSGIYFLIIYSNHKEAKRFKFVTL